MTATLDTVARPTWLSGIRKASVTGASTAPRYRTRVGSGPGAGSISAMTSNGVVTTRNAAWI